MFAGSLQITSNINTNNPMSNDLTFTDTVSAQLQANESLLNELKMPNNQSLQAQMNMPNAAQTINNANALNMGLNSVLGQNALLNSTSLNSLSSQLATSQAQGQQNQMSNDLLQNGAGMNVKSEHLLYQNGGQEEEDNGHNEHDKDGDDEEAKKRGGGVWRPY